MSKEYGGCPEGQAGIGTKGFSKYDPSGAEITKNGGNTADQDSITSEQSPESFYGGGQGSLKKSKEV